MSSANHEHDASAGDEQSPAGEPFGTTEAPGEPAGFGDPIDESDSAGDAAGDVGPADSETLESLINEDIDKIAAERDEYLDSLRRLQADFDNFRKRAVRQQTELLERASENVLVALLPVLDALDLAEAHAPADTDTGALTQVGTLLRGTLEREGLERIDAVGVPFDPTVHDAVAHEEADEADGDDAKGAVSEVMRAGYQLKGRVVRPAMVKVKG